MRMDFSERCVVSAFSQPRQTDAVAHAQWQWLELDEMEGVRSTCIVQLAPDSHLELPCHGSGEELFILDGHLSDTLGDYGPGTFIKNAPGSSLTPYSRSGCTLFVKQGHLDERDQSRVVIDSAGATWRPGLVSGLSVLPLHEFITQHTAMVRWAPETCFSTHRHYGGEEILVLDGVFEDEHGHYPAGTWIRSPHLSQHQPFSHEGCLILVKVGHLA